MKKFTEKRKSEVLDKDSDSSYSQQTLSQQNPSQKKVKTEF